jgi:hypothetical protein
MIYYVINLIQKKYIIKINNKVLYQVYLLVFSSINIRIYWIKIREIKNM